MHHFIAQIVNEFLQTLHWKPPHDWVSLVDSHPLIPSAVGKPVSANAASVVTTRSDAMLSSTVASLPLFTGIKAVLFDLDGVLTPTAELHMRAWARLFESIFAQYDIEHHGEGQSITPYTDADYFAHIDGRPRYDGVADVLASRNITVPWGQPSDPVDAETVCGFGNRKNDEFRAELTEHGIQPYPGTLLFLSVVQQAGWHAAVVSSSRNASIVLEAAGIIDRFPLIVDGLTAAERGLAGKPAPDCYIWAARALGVAPDDALVVEDAVSGVQSGHSGGFRVLGVNRGAGAELLRQAGAQLVVSDLGDLVSDK